MIKKLLISLFNFIVRNSMYLIWFWVLAYVSICWLTIDTKGVLTLLGFVFTEKDIVLYYIIPCIVLIPLMLYDRFKTIRGESKDV